MNDPWDVKCVRQSDHYVSCMKLNGVPLLPPVLSKECRKEMQYYKLLAKEVEKRISYLKSFVIDSDEESAQDKTDAPELPQDYEKPSETLRDVLQATFDVNHTALRDEKNPETFPNSPNLHDSISSNSQLEHSWPSSNLLVELSFNQDKAENCKTKIKTSPQHILQAIEPPERDYNTTPKKNTSIQKECEIVTNVDISFDKTRPEIKSRELLSIEFDITKVKPHLSDPLPDMPMVDGPSSLGTKSFTGSLDNIHREGLKETSNLVRQSSYTVLNPSPLLLAHLKVQSLTTGVEVTSISMSESLSNLATPKKRRSWDLESAKIKWSSMAHELKQKTAVNNKVGDNNRKLKSTVHKTQASPLQSKISPEQPRRASFPGKPYQKSEPIQKPKRSPSVNRSLPSSMNLKEPVNNHDNQKCNQSNGNLISEVEDPATKVRELYEKIQNQQLMQMASLIEKQKREQMLLQQVFEEQNSILFRQLKTICPKSPVEAKAAWADKLPQTDRGPVSLSQLINHSPQNSPLESTLTSTHDDLNKCDAVLKKSKDITGSLKKRGKQSPCDPRSPKSPEGSRTRTHSPSGRWSNTARKLSYDTASDREEPMTDRTNDTLAGLNVTFTSDSDDCPTLAPRAADSPLRSMEGPTRRPIRPVQKRGPLPTKLSPTPEQRAAATTIVAYARGYLVRRLLRTARVRATVQTLRDALLCALQMHRERAGIRGADVDLHRRLIQQITAACYSLHDTFVASSPAARCALIAADRERLKRPPARLHRRQSDIMSHSHSGAFPARAPRSPSAHALMTHSNYETFSGTKLGGRSYQPPPPRRPWR